jgi:hypothetical protein
MEEDEMGGACSKHEHKSSAYKIFAGKPGGKNNSEDIDEDGTIILEWILGK